MKKSDLTFAILQIPLDLIFIFFAFYLAYILRGKVEIPQTTVYMWPYFQYAKFVLMFLPIWLAIFGLEGLYNIKNPKRGLSLVTSIFLGVSAGMAIMVLWIFFSRFLFFSRLIVIYAWLFSILFISFGRFLLNYLQHFLYKRGIGLKQVVVIGDGPFGKKISLLIKNNPALGFKLVKSLDREGIAKLNQILSRHSFDEIILANPNLTERESMAVLEFCEDHKLSFKMTPNTFRAKTTNVEIGAISSYPMLEFKKTPLDGWGKVAKRCFDILFSFIGLIILLPFFLLVSLIIKLCSKGSIFFQHQRMGADEKIFYLIKFRSMVENAPSMYKDLAKNQKKTIFLSKIQHDPRITKFGAFLRATCIDELPQLFNVLKGEMSLVGPRPLTPEEFQHVATYEKKYSFTTYIKPGMTGLWQVSGRVELSDAERLSLDLYYVENWSLLLDLWMIFKTPFALLKNRGIY